MNQTQSIWRYGYIDVDINIDGRDCYNKIPCVLSPDNQRTATYYLLYFLNIMLPINKSDKILTLATRNLGGNPRSVETLTYQRVNLIFLI